MKLSGQRVLVTGASSGIGAEISREMARRGSHLILVARGAEKLEALAGELRENGATVEIEVCDLSSDAEIARLAGRVLDGDGAPDVLINNAGAGRWLATWETEAGYAEEAMRLPYLAAYELTRQLLPAMLERGSGWILNMTSAAGFLAIPGATAYAVARWAMRAFSYELEAELRGSGIGVTLLVPFEVDSPYFDNNPGSRERIPKIARLIGEMTPADVAQEAADSIEHERRERMLPWRGRLIYRLTPPPLMRWLLSSTGWKRQKGQA
ncbi:MAG: SDR family NAD(P)-dependent oxidoreductase [Thermoleophilia bacterium]|nr:SDR family NAD(P)-dependent oxidoreductase [Thermoleophilia bacterium]